MPREVSRRTSRPPETKAKVSYPDQPGKRDLDPNIVSDVPDPAPDIEADAIQRGKDMDHYLENLGPVVEEAPLNLRNRKRERKG